MKENENDIVEFPKVQKVFKWGIVSSIILLLIDIPIGGYGFFQAVRTDLGDFGLIATLRLLIDTFVFLLLIIAGSAITIKQYKISNPKWERTIGIMCLSFILKFVFIEIMYVFGCSVARANFVILENRFDPTFLKLIFHLLFFNIIWFAVWAIWLYNKNPNLKPPCWGKIGGTALLVVYVINPVVDVLLFLSFILIAYFSYA